MKIMILGDLCPFGKYQHSLLSSAFPEDFAVHFEGVDHVVANLESPLTNRLNPIPKGGPHLAADPGVADGMARLGIRSVTLANNHIMDHGEDGLQSTALALDEAGIQHFGAGSNLAEAIQPLRLEHQLDSCLLMGFAEREYSYAEAGKPGAAPADLSLMVRLIEAYRGKMPSVVLLHAGNENYPYPSPLLQDKCRLLIELGSLAVVCQHSHCIGSYEVWQGGLIVYGQGNFMFDYPSTRPEWLEGLMVELDIVQGKLQSFSFHPVFQTQQFPYITTDAPGRRERVMAALEERSAQITDTDTVRELWAKFVQSKCRSYQSLLFGHNRWLYALNKIVGFSNWHSKSSKMNIGNILRCESHLEVVQSIFSLENMDKYE